MNEPGSPSKERLRRALREGDSPISAVAGRTATFAAALVLVPALGAAAATRFEGRVREALAPGFEPRPASMVAEAITDVAMLVGPLVAAVAAAGVLVGLVQTSGMVAFRRVAPRLDRFAPRFADGRRLFGATRGAVAAALLVAVATVSLRTAMPALARAIGRPRELAAASSDTLNALGLRALAALVLVAAADVAFQRAAFRDRWRQSVREARRERREQEGDPLLRRARRRAHEELVR